MAISEGAPMNPSSILTAMLSVILLALSGVETGNLPNLATGAQAEATSSAGAPGGKYSASDAVDGNENTWWACPVKAKLPQTLKVTLAKPAEADAVLLLKARNETLYANLREIELRFDDGSKVSHTLKDNVHPEVIRFKLRRVAWIELAVLSTYAEKVYFGLAELMAFRDPKEEIFMAAAPPPAPKDKWHNVKLTQLRREKHPCVYITPADVERAKKNIQRWPWAKSYAADIVKNGDGWLKRPDEWFAQQLPAKGACFAYGFTGCPICSSSWGTWGGARCSWDKPGKVTCANGHELPDAEHPDPGTGHVGKDGRIHYFIGSYNAWVVEQLESSACRSLALAYTLTGDERYAHKAAIILDALASIYPGCTSGSWDYPSKPPSGRFSRPWYQVARVLIHYVNHYDQIFHAKSLDAPSLVPGLTRRQNIEDNLLKNGAWYCYEQSLKGGLHNGEADYIRGALAVGCALGIPEYVDWALDGPYGIRSYLANNVDRDGRYYETSMSYSIHTRDLYLTFSEPLINWTKPVNLCADAKFRAFFTLPELTANCFGHTVSYGDQGPDTSKRYDPPRKFSASDYNFAEILFARAATPEDKAAYGALVTYLANGKVDAARAASNDKHWLLFHAEDPPAGEPKLTEWLDRRLNRTDFLGREGIGVLRAGNGRDAQALLLRYGQSLNHGHFDDLNINYYALGREVTYDLGYGLGSTHTQVGWSKQTASHNLVVVNEKTQRGGPAAASGGSLLFLADTPLAQVIEAESANSSGKEGVTEYRRLCALIGEGRRRYLLDVFRVTGGQQ
ncbi:MAG: hypothetical protein FJ279_26330, partial [Planctomycetes bacterium]|nr:hypothetical protein [Planctomycetota bacterium]